MSLWSLWQLEEGVVPFVVEGRHFVCAKLIWVACTLPGAATRTMIYCMIEAGLDSGFWILDSGFWILDFGLWILDSGLQGLVSVGALVFKWFLEKWSLA